MTCIIVEDIQSYTQVLTTYLSEIGDIEIIATAETEEDAVEKILKLNPDLVFMDIKLGKGSGFEVLDKTLDSFKYVIFTTAYSEFSLTSYNYNTIHYLLKPYKKEVVIQAVEKARKFLFEKSEMDLGAESFFKNETPKNIIFIPNNNTFIPIEIASIIYLEADTSYTYIHMANDSYKISKPLKSVLESIKGNLEILRIHKSYAINLKYIKNIKRGLKSSVLLSNNIEIPISINEKDEIFRMLGIRN